MRRLSARPHHVGSPYDKENAEWILARFKEWGFDAKIETFNVLFPTPKNRLLEMIGVGLSGSIAGAANPATRLRVRRPSNFPPTTPIRRTAT